MTAKSFSRPTKTTNITTYSVLPTRLSLILQYYDVRAYLRIKLQSGSWRWLGVEEASPTPGGHGPNRRHQDEMRDPLDAVGWALCW